MKQRINVHESNPNALKSLYPISGFLAKSTIEKNLFHLLYYRVSQINGCAFCLDMHSKDLRAAGEDEQRIYVVNAWREAPFYSARERAALAFAEELTVIGRLGVSDAVYDEAAAVFTENELVDLTMAVIAINSYNRLNIAFGVKAGNYQPAVKAA